MTREEAKQHIEEQLRNGKMDVAEYIILTEKINKGIL